MKKIILASLLFSLILVLSSCGKTDTSHTIVVGATPSPHAEILEAAKPLLADLGYTLKIVEFNDYILPNQGLTSGDLDANYFQHVPYLNSYNSDHNTHIVSAGGVHFEPIGIYSKKYTRLDQLPDGANIYMSNSVSDQGRMLGILQENGLITIDSTVDVSHATLDDIVSNPKHLQLKATIAPEMLAKTFEEDDTVDAILINTNFVLTNQISETNRIASESVANASQYINIIAVNTGHETDDKIVALVSVLHSQTIKDYIANHYYGAVVSAE